MIFILIRDSLKKETFRFDQIKNGLKLEENMVQLLRESKWLVTV